MQYGMQSSVSDNVALRHSLWAVRCVVDRGTAPRIVVATGISLDARVIGRWNRASSSLSTTATSITTARDLSRPTGESGPASGGEGCGEEDALSRFASGSAKASDRSSGQEREKSVDWTLTTEEIARKRRCGDDPG